MHDYGGQRLGSAWYQESRLLLEDSDYVAHSLRGLVEAERPSQGVFLVFTKCWISEKNLNQIKT